MQDGEVIVTSFSPDDRWIATGSEDEQARVYDLGSGTQILSRRYKGVVDSLAFSVSGRWLLAGDHNAARIIDFINGNEMLQFSIKMKFSR